MHKKDIGYLIKNINDKLKTRADADLKEQNLTLAQSNVIIFLYDREDYMSTQKELEVFLEISHPAVVGIVSRMEQNGHIITWFDPHNRRNKIVQLTPQAQLMGKKMTGLRQHWEEKMTEGLSGEEIEQLKNMLWKVNQNLS